MLYELVKQLACGLDLKLPDIVGQCLGCASNMSGVRNGVLARMKECS